MNKKLFIAIFLGIIFTVINSCKKEVSTSKLYVIEENGLYGFIDSVGNKVIKPQYLYAQSFTEGLALVVVDTIYGDRIDSTAYKYEGKPTTKRSYLCAKYGYINKNGEFVIKPTLITSFYVTQEDRGHLDFKIINWFDKFAFSNQRALFQDDKTFLYGYMDQEGKQVIPSLYVFGNNFFQSRAVVLKYTGKYTGPDKYKCQYGIIDKDNNVIADFEYYSATNFNSNHAIVRKWKKDELKGLQNVISQNDKGEYELHKEDFTDTWDDIVLILNKNGQITDSLSSIDEYYGFQDGISAARDRYLSSIYNTNVFYYVDTLGNRLKPLYRITEEEANELALSKQIFSIIPENELFLNCTRFSNNLAGVTMNGDVWVFIDKHFLVRGQGLENTYDYIKPFNKGLAAVMRKGKWGYVNTALKQVIPCKYDSCEINYGLLEKVYIYKGDSVISKYVNRKDSAVWSHTELRGYNNEYKNIYSQKDRNMFGKWRNIDTIQGTTIEIVWYIVFGLVFNLSCISFIILWYRRKKK